MKVKFYLSTCKSTFSLFTLGRGARYFGNMHGGDSDEVCCYFNANTGFNL